jgi:hypothetical protein
MKREEQNEFTGKGPGRHFVRSQDSIAILLCPRILRASSLNRDTNSALDISRKADDRQDWDSAQSLHISGLSPNTGDRSAKTWTHERRASDPSTQAHQDHRRSLHGPHSRQRAQGYRSSYRGNIQISQEPRERKILWGFAPFCTTEKIKGVGKLYKRMTPQVGLEST